MSTLLLEGLRAGYGPQKVLDGVNFSVGTGELCGLLGLNGSGKSTLLKAVCGLIACSAEAMTIDGKPLGRMNERERAGYLAYIPQRSSTGGGLTVTDMVLMGFNPKLRLLERPGRDQRALAARTMVRVGLGDFGERLFDEISEGQRQLAVFARALVQDAPVMLMDEPDSALDFTNRHLVLGKIAQTVRDEGRAGLITLHDPNSAMAYCDRLLLLKGGKLVGDVAPAEVTTAELERQLGQIYGAVNVFEHGGVRMMVKR